ncbi:hypothetical protein FHS89_001125 [Rubricella aquisinus]|uniref:Uncharacterized protein n=1 Tax=Rubricella aquisinus TaxID=2028108 RepID=A0A840WZM5_9RHOB|nr:hypothetical protein [Rubricella aquisinus]MBB5515115.1 hypothetical protein [Rubricella aquisinus]
MTRTQGVLLDVLTPVRDIFLSRLLEEMASALDKGFECETDVLRRIPSGSVERAGSLNLPERYDLATEVRGDTATFDVTDSLVVRFDPFSLQLGNGANVRISPFQWNDLHVAVELRRGVTPNWQPIRRWYLEAFQVRFDEDTPEFHGVIHRLTGPEKVGATWVFNLDLGTASVDCLTDLFDALEQCQAANIELFGAEDDRERVESL